MVTILTFNDRAKSAAGKTAIANLVSAEIASNKGWVGNVRGILSAYTPDDAPYILEAVNAAVAAERSKKTNTKVEPAPVNPQRVSEWKGLFKMKGWDCYERFLANMEPVDPPLSGIVDLSNWFRSKDSAIAKKGGTAPTRDAIIAKLAARNVRTPKPKMEGLDKVKARPAEVLAAISENLEHLATMEGKGKGASFLATALKAVSSYRPMLEAHVANAAAEAARKAALAKFTAGK